MKILKVELQNINSLKSDHPIIVDFESDTFKDVGLYAITGSTGSGKTTILDAITIALYHNVPRLNKSKAGLADVVSYGASDALSRVTFENKDNIYEAQWTLRVLSKGGKTLNKPDEQIRLKNLTSDEIIAEKKKDFSAKIVEVTQLNYNQFLRSVMLAQGEFASFLSAPPKDKGALLEQITGEEIYRKIGEVLNNRLSEERKKIVEIKSRINNEDILSEVERKFLNHELKNISEESKKLESKIKDIEAVTIWYKEDSELSKSKKELEIEIENLEVYKKENESKLIALNHHEEAEPFIETLNNIKRLNGEISNKQKQVNDLEKQIKLTEENIEKSKLENAKLKKSFKEKDIENNLWQEKLQEVTEIDTEVKSNKETINKTKFQVDELIKISRSTKDDIKKFEDIKKVKFETKAKFEKYLVENSDIPNLQDYLNNWSSKLAGIKVTTERLENDRDAISEKEKKLKETRNLYRIENEKLDDKSNLQQQLNDELSAISKKLKENNLQESLKKSSDLTNQKQKWNDLKRISSEYNKLSTTLKRAKLDEKENIQSKNSSLKTKLQLEKDIKQVKLTLSDAKKILVLEQKIKSFDYERKKLKHGEACGLCGSTSHPYIDNYTAPKVSEAEIELKNREEKLEVKQKSLHDIDLELTKINTELLQLEKTISTSENNINLLEVEYKELNFTCAIDDEKTAKGSFIKIIAELKTLNNTISKIHKIQKQKDEKEVILKQVDQAVNSIKIIKSELETTGSNLNEEIDNRNKELNSLSKELNAKQSKIKSELNEFNLTLPNITEHSSFIVDLESKIKTYQNKKDELKNIEHKISDLEKEIKNSNKTLLEKNKEVDILKTELSVLTSRLSLKSEKRNNILSSEISIEQKRLELKTSLNGVHKLLENSTQNLQDLEKKIEGEKANRTNIREQLDSSKIEFYKLSEELNLNIAKSNFITKENLEKAILTREIKKDYAEIDKKIIKRNIAIKIKGESLSKIEKKLNSTKSFNISEEEAIANSEKLKSEEKSLSERKGNISQQIIKDNKIRDRNKLVFKEIDAQESIINKWFALHKLLGGSKDSFNTYVQRLTLESLIALANQHLYKLNKRYSLEINKTFKEGEELNFSLVDHYQTDRLRPVDTTSGGEKFLISLALALGLSDLASNNVSIDSLFIDEGFGTLDPNMLETVISTLETLQTQGKMIGIISHVENLKERISTQIKIHKNSNGVSTIEIV